MAVLCCARARRGDWAEVIDVANGCFWGGLGHHQKGADSLRLRLLLMKMRMFCLQCSGSVFVILGAAKCSDDDEIPLEVYYDVSGAQVTTSSCDASVLVLATEEKESDMRYT